MDRARSKTMRSFLAIACFVYAICGQLQGASVLVPSTPEEIIRQAEFIAVGVLAVAEDGEIVFKVLRDVTDEHAKGEILHFTPKYRNLVNLETLEKETGGSPTVFIGKLDEEGLLIPRYAYWSFWPQGIPKTEAESVRLMDMETMVAFIEKIRGEPVVEHLPE